MDNTEEWTDTIKILTEKGYDGFMMSLHSIGKLDEIVEVYLKQKRENKIGSGESLWVSTYISYNGEEKPYVQCDMWLHMQIDRLTVERMIIQKSDEYGQRMSRQELEKLSLENIPSKEKALQMVNETIERKIAPEHKRGLRL